MLFLTCREIVYEEIRGMTRTIDFTFTLATILVDYKFSFRNVEPETPEYEVVYHTVNKRCAEKTLRLCRWANCLMWILSRRLGGYYIKLGQMVSTLEQGIPREWIDTLSLCQVGCVGMIRYRTKRLLFHSHLFQE